MYSIVLLVALNGAGETPAFGHRGGCHGGCHGGGYSCGGGYGGCYGGCYGGGYSCCGGYGGGYVMSSGCYGGCYGAGCYGGGYRPSASPTPPPDGGRKKVPPVDEGGEKKTTPPGSVEAGPAPVTLVVHLPDDARLTIDGNATKSTSETRVFTSPALPRGKELHYTL
jgi:hypothetical protein